MLPPKRERKSVHKAGLYQAHRKWVRSHCCSIPGCFGGPIEFAHLRTAANSGMGMKPPDWYGISLCERHHRIAHNLGHETMARACGMTLEALFDIAREFAQKSPDMAMRAAMKEERDEGH